LWLLPVTFPFSRRTLFSYMFMSHEPFCIGDFRRRARENAESVRLLVSQQRAMPSAYQPAQDGLSTREGERVAAGALRRLWRADLSTGMACEVLLQFEVPELVNGA
jgi:hypothetical protein